MDECLTSPDAVYPGRTNLRPFGDVYRKVGMVIWGKISRKNVL